MNVPGDNVNSEPDEIVKFPLEIRTADVFGFDMVSDPEGLRLPVRSVEGPIAIAPEVINPEDPPDPIVTVPETGPGTKRV